MLSGIPAYSFSSSEPVGGFKLLERMMPISFDKERRKEKVKDQRSQLLGGRSLRGN